MSISKPSSTPECTPTFLADLLKAIEAEKASHPEKHYIAVAINGNSMMPSKTEDFLIGTSPFAVVSSREPIEKNSPLYDLSSGEAWETRQDLNQTEGLAKDGNITLLESPIAVVQNEFALWVTERGREALDNDLAIILPSHRLKGAGATIFVGNFEQITNQMAAWADRLGLKCDRLWQNHRHASTIGNKKSSKKALKEMEDLAWLCRSLRCGLPPHFEQYQDFVRLGKLALLSGGSEKLKQMHEPFQQVLEAHGKSFEEFCADVEKYN